MIPEPKTLGDCWAIYEEAGLQKPDHPMDSTIFHNAKALAGILNQRDTLKAENEALLEDLEWVGAHLESIFISLGGRWELQWINGEGDHHTTVVNSNDDETYAQTLRKAITEARLE